MLKIIPVTAAIIVKNNHVLVAKRPGHGHLAGLWEFPGGKVEDGESPLQCLKRELAEELQIYVYDRTTAFFDLSFYEYGMKRVLLIGMTVNDFEGVITPVEHAAVRWVKREDIGSVRLAPADVPLARKLLKYGKA